jgi:RNA polymerase sigma-70 factor, ECF subfamily
MDDRELIRRCQGGEKAAFQELIIHYHPFVSKFLIKLTGDYLLVEDLAQDVFLKMIRCIDTYDGNGKAKLSTYLLTIARNTYIDYLRKEKRLAQLEAVNQDYFQSIAVPGFENMIVDRIYCRDIMKQIEQLTEEQKIAIHLKYIEGLTLKEIGELLQVESKTVKSRIHNGMAKLKKRMGLRGEENDGSI